MQFFFQTQVGRAFRLASANISCKASALPYNYLRAYTHFSDIVGYKAGWAKANFLGYVMREGYR